MPNQHYNTADKKLKNPHEHQLQRKNRKYARVRRG